MTARLTPLLRKGHAVQRRTGLHPSYPSVEMLELRWVERAPVVSCLITLYDRLGDFPNANHRTSEGTF